jgi:hypothetical protein
MKKEAEFKKLNEDLSKLKTKIPAIVRYVSVETMPAAAKTL